MLSPHLFLLVVSLLLLLFKQDGVAVVVLSVIFACVELYIWSRREGKEGTLNWCHPVPVFVLGYCIVFYQLPFCYLAGYTLDPYSKYILFSPENIPYCVLLAASGLAAFFCGEQFFFLNRNKLSGGSRSSKGKNTYTVTLALVRIKAVNTIILIATLFFYLLYLKSMGGVSVYFGFAYGDTSIDNAMYSSHFGFAYIILLYLSIMLDLTRLVYIQPTNFRSYIGAWDKRVLAVIFITLVPFIMSGDRGSYLQPMALVIVPYFIFVKPLLFKQAIIAVLGLIVILAIIGDTRGRTNITWTDAMKDRIESISNPAKWPTMELGNSFGTFNIATVYFPEINSYNYGIGTVYRIAALVPFSSFVTEIEQKNKDNDFVYSSSLFFTNILTKGSFSSGSGTSSLADVYMDFGPYGIPVVLFIWGYFIAWICNKALATDSAVFVFLYAYYTYFSIYVNRSSFFFGWNQFVWVILLFFIIKHLFIDTPSVYYTRAVKC